MLLKRQNWPVICGIIKLLQIPSDLDKESRPITICVYLDGLDEMHRSKPLIQLLLHNRWTKSLQINGKGAATYFLATKSCFCCKSAS